MLIGRRRKPKRSHERQASWRLRLEYLEDRLALSGGLDPSFDVDGKLTIPFDLGGTNDDEARAVLAQPDGKTVAVGFAASSAGDLDFAVTRTLPDGQPDFAFDNDGKVVVSFDLGGTNDDQAFAAALQSDGKIVIAGRAAVPGEADVAVVRLTSDGLLDDTFDFDGKQTISFDLGGSGIDDAFGVTIDSFGRIVVAGRAETGVATFDIAIARLNSDGAPDSTFSGNGKQTIGLDLGGDNIDVGRSLTVQRDGRIVVAGRAELPGGDFDMAVIRLNDDGSLDPTFDQDGVQTVAFDLGGAKEDNATSITLQTNGAIVLVGSAEQGSGDFDFAVARLATDGSLDVTFGGDGKQTIAFDLGGSNQDKAMAVAIQTGGKIVVAGHAQLSSGDFDFGIAQLNPDGSLDLGFDGDGKQVVTFDLGGFNDDRATAVAIQANREIVVAGFVDSSSGDADFAVARIFGDNIRYLAIGGAPGRAEVYGVDSVQLGFFAPFAGSGYGGGVSVSLGDVDSDGIDDLAVAATTGNPHTKIYDGAALAAGVFFTNPELYVLAQGFAYGVNFNVGANVALGDMNGDGFADLVTGAVPGNPHVRVFDAQTILSTGFIPTNNFDPSVLAEGFVYGVNFNVGANVALADINGDGRADLMTGASAGNPHTKVFDASGLLSAGIISNGNDANLVAQFFPYALQFNVGTFVSAGDYNFDGFIDVFTGASSGNPHVVIFDGQDLALGTFDANGSVIESFFAFEAGQNLGLSIAAADFTGDGGPDILVGTRSGIPRHRIFLDNVPSEPTLLESETHLEFVGPLWVAA